ncbi:MAG: hypothetical protein SOT34_00350 [Candidatus Borkfalkiaceae bacterium]|nr:hypothetical protein [Christensenellaceae bacterium]
MSRFNDEDLVTLFTLAEEAKREGKSLGGVFAEVSKRTGTAKGSVRNLYYKKLKEKAEGSEKTMEFLKNSELKASRVLSFSDEEARQVVRNILLGASKGKSVRRTVAELSHGDEKTALRYQNKYRNMLRNDKETVRSIVGEIRRERGYCFDPYAGKKGKGDLLSCLRREIDGLCTRLAGNVAKENVFLKETVEKLSRENADLRQMLRGLEGKTSPARVYFERVDDRMGKKDR